MSLVMDEIRYYIYNNTLCYMYGMRGDTLYYKVWGRDMAVSLGEWYVSNRHDFVDLEQYWGNDMLPVVPQKFTHEVRARGYNVKCREFRT